MKRIKIKGFARNPKLLLVAIFCSLITLLGVIGPLAAYADVGPTTTYYLSPSNPDGNNDWYVSYVTVNLAATAPSGIAKTEYSLDGGNTWTQYSESFTVTSEGVTNVLARSIANDGKVESPPLSIQLSIDITDPDIIISEPQSETYLHSDTIVIDYSVTDATSGVATAEATLDESVVSDGQTIDLFFMSIGEHAFSVDAEDNASNTASQSVPFEVIATIQSTQDDVQHAYDLDLIDNAGITNSLTSKLEAAEQSQDKGNDKTFDNQLNAFTNHLEAQSGKHVTSQAADILIADAVSLQ